MHDYTHRTERVERDRPARDAGTAEATEAPTLLDVHEVFDDPHCRSVLSQVQRDGSVTVGELAERLSEDAPTGRRTPLRELCRELATLGLVTYDPRADTVELPEDVTVSLRAD